MLGQEQIGVILNDVPERDLRDVHKVLKPWLERHNITVYGVLNHEPGLSAMRVSDLANGMSGRIVAGNAQCTRMVNGFILGTMQVDAFMAHLRNREHCAVIVSGDRVDLQLAALHAKTVCIILTGNMNPPEFIRAKAEAAGVTLIVVREDAYSAARAMSRILRSKKLRDLEQIRLAVALAERNLDMETLLPAMRR
jgi:BioD-like phosphotransacetylase family protein